MHAHGPAGIFPPFALPVKFHKTWLLSIQAKNDDPKKQKKEENGEEEDLEEDEDDVEGEEEDEDDELPEADEDIDDGEGSVHNILKNSHSQMLPMYNSLRIIQ